MARNLRTTENRIEKMTERRTDVNGSIYKRKNKYVLFVFFLFTIAFAYPQTKLEMLERAYKNNSKKELKVFLDNWSREITPITNEELSTYNDTIKEAYKVFVDFYNNYRLDSSYSKEYNDMYENVDFLIVPNALYIFFEDSLLYRDWFERNGKLTDSIMNFRPTVQCNGKIPLYLSKKYKEGMDIFLKDKEKKYKYLSLDRTKESFLDNYVRIVSGHWGGWHLCSFPIIYVIIFDKDMKYVEINYRDSWCTGGKVIFKKEGDTWMFFRKNSRWIE